jgi:hypothetical protein
VGLLPLLPAAGLSTTLTLRELGAPARRGTKEERPSLHRSLAEELAGECCEDWEGVESLWIS